MERSCPPPQAEYERMWATEVVDKSFDPRFDKYVAILTQERLFPVNEHGVAAIGKQELWVRLDMTQLLPNEKHTNDSRELFDKAPVFHYCGVWYQTLHA